MALDRSGTRRLLGGLLLLFALPFAACDGAPSGGPSIDEPAEVSGAGGHHHDAPGETCFLCDPSKREPGRLWCSEHGRYEDRCWECQPQLRDPDRPYCEEHGLYEDECFLCRPDLKKVEPGKGGAAGEAHEHREQGVELFCSEHHVPEEQCGICQPQRAAELGAGEELLVRFESPRAAAKAGIRTVEGREVIVRPSVSAFAEVAYNQNALARITPLAPGIVQKVFADVGADVVAGDVLVEVHSAEVAGAKAEFVSAVVDLALKQEAYRREQRLAKRSISSAQEVQEADAARKTAEIALSTARQRLLNYGFTAGEVAEIEEARDTSAVLLVRAPFDGTLVERGAVVGEAVRPGQSLFSLADLGTMWLTLSIPSDRAGLIRKGMAVEATFRGLGDEKASGEITWVDPSIDEMSRMLIARAVVVDEKRRLKAGMFGQARIFVGEPRSAVEIPREAVQYLEARPYVFLRVEDDLYAMRRVVLEDEPSKDTVAVIEGLRPDEAVAVTGAFTAMSEFLKSRLGAGCVDDK